MGLITRARTTRAAFLGAALILAAYATTPRIGDAPPDVAAKTVVVDGHAYILITGTNLDPSSQLNVARAMQAGDNLIRVDVAAAPFQPFSRNPIATNFPLLIDAPPGAWTIEARKTNHYTPIATCQIPPQ